MPVLTPSSRRIEPALLSVYVVIAAITVLGLVVFLEPGRPLRWAGLALLAAFDLLVLLPDRALGGFKVRAPHLYVALATTLTSALIVLPPANPWFAVLFFVLSPEVMLRFPRQTGYAWVGVFAAVTVILFWVMSGGLLGILATALIYIAGYFFFAAFATQTALADAAQAESRRLLQELQEAHTRLQAYAAQAEALAVAEERNRLAREMHDTLGHRLTVVAVQLEAITRLAATDPERAASMAAAAREEIRTALTELRQTVAALRAPLEADLPLEPALRRLAAEFETATGLAVTLNLPPDLPDLPATHRLALYRAAQEGLTNVQKHAAATHVWLTLAVSTDRVSLSVADDGRGPRPNATGSGFGLHGLRERAEYLGGSVDLRPRPQGGAELVMTLPLPPEVDHA
ncbi:MAG: sensor histidine kinase [Anaerolineae bacterium]|nr:sensor histidine kinase [Caldilineales bacterium]MDW8267569.1 sensor histidine kinase [Anaerolineae bacterium]